MSPGDQKQDILPLSLKVPISLISSQGNRQIRSSCKIKLSPLVTKDSDPVPANIYLGNLKPSKATDVLYSLSLPLFIS